MGTAVFDLVKYSRNRGIGAGTVAGELVTSGAHTTSTSASNLTNGAADGGSAITAPVGTVLRIVCDEAARVVVGGGTATASVGYYLQPDVRSDIEISAGGTVSIIDVA